MDFQHKVKSSKVKVTRWVILNTGLRVGQQLSMLLLRRALLIFSVISDMLRSCLNLFLSVLDFPGKILTSLNRGFKVKVRGMKAVIKRPLYTEYVLCI